MPSEYTGSRLKHVSYSELSTYRQCPHKHQLAYIERWDKEEAAVPLTRGRIFHEMLAAHYEALKLGELERVGVDVVLSDVEDEELADLLSWMYDGYIDHYFFDAQWGILEVEKKEEIWLPTEDGRRSTYRLKMIIDLLVADEQGRIWLVDHKTNADFPNELGLDLDDQFSLYAWGLTQLGYNVHGVIYNCIRTRRNKGPMALDDRFRRVMMYRTPEQLRNTAIDAWRTTRRMRSAEWAERTTNSDTCQWRCSYTEACLWGRKGGDEREFLTSAGFVPDSEHS